MTQTKSKIIVISGPTGAGKDSVQEELFKILSEYNVKKLVSYTTRPKRITEKEGVEYFFTDEDFYQTLIDDNKILSARVYYGIPQGKTTPEAWHYGLPYPKEDGCYITILDGPGYSRILHKLSAESVFGFYLFADQEELYERCMSSRGDANELETLRRIKDDLTVFENYKPIYKHIIDTSKLTVEEVAKNIKSKLEEFDFFSNF